LTTGTSQYSKALCVILVQNHLATIMALSFQLSALYLNLWHLPLSHP